MSNLKQMVLDHLEQGTFVFVTDDEEWVTIKERFTIDPSKYVSSSYRPVNKKEEANKSPLAVKPVKPVTAPVNDEASGVMYCKNIGMCRRKGKGFCKNANNNPQCFNKDGVWHRFDESSVAMDEAIAMDVQSCESSYEDCRAKNPLYCPYHGTKLIQDDIRQKLVAAGVRGQIDVDADEGDTDTGKGFSVTVRCPKSQENLVREQLRAFMSLPGITQNEDEPDLSYDRDEHGITAWYDVDLLKADEPPEDAPAAREDGGEVQPQEETPNEEPPAEEQPQAEEQPAEEQPQNTEEQPQHESEQAAQPSDIFEDATNKLIEALGEEQRDYIKNSMDSFKESGKFVAIPIMNQTLESRYKGILGEDHPIFHRDEGSSQEQPQQQHEEDTRSFVERFEESQQRNADEADRQVKDAVGSLGDMVSGISAIGTGRMSIDVGDDGNVEAAAQKLNSILGSHFLVVSDPANHAVRVVGNTDHGANAVIGFMNDYNSRQEDGGSQNEESNEEQNQPRLSQEDINQAVLKITDAYGEEFGNRAKIELENFARTGLYAPMIRQYHNNIATVLGNDSPVMNALNNAIEQERNAAQQERQATQEGRGEFENYGISDADIHSLAELQVDLSNGLLNTEDNERSIRAALRGDEGMARTLLGATNEQVRHNEGYLRIANHLLRMGFGNNNGEGNGNPRNEIGHPTAQVTNVDGSRFPESLGFHEDANDHHLTYSGIVAPENEIARHTPYTWPAGRGQRIQPEQITPELINSVLANVPTGRRSRWGNIRDTERLRELLRSGVSRYSRANVMFNRMNSSTNVHARRLMQIFETLQPNMVSERRRAEAERLDSIRRYREESERRQAAYSLASMNRDGNTATDFTDTEFAGIESTLKEKFPDYPNEVDSFMRAIRTSSAPNETQMHYIDNVFGNDSDVANRLRERYREKVRREEGHKLFRPTDIPQEVQEKNDEVFASNGVTRNPNGLDSIKVTGMSNGYTCYATSQAIRARFFGYDVDTKPTPSSYEGTTRTRFLKSRRAMHDKGFETSNRSTPAETSANLERIRETYPNGTFLDNWHGGSSGHGTSAILIDKQWYKFDGFYGAYWMPVSSSSLVSAIDSMGTMVPDEVRNDDRQRRLLIIQGKRSVSVDERKNYTDEQFMNMGYNINRQEPALLSYVLKPTDGFSPETFECITKK